MRNLEEKALKRIGTPYLPKFADKFKEVIRGLHTKHSFYNLNKLGGIIKAQNTSSQN